MTNQNDHKRAELLRARFLLCLKQTCIIVFLCLLSGTAYADDLWNNIKKLLPFSHQDDSNNITGKKNTNDKTKDFDFYVLALSWTPTHCKLNSRSADRHQCGDRPFGFTVHGLWPQFNKGYPEYCQTTQSYVPRHIVSQLSSIMPSAGLIGYQWRKHGSCSGLSQAAYFNALKSAYNKVVIPSNLRNLTSAQNINPQQIKNTFLRANSQMKSDNIIVTCRANHLQEVRICMSKDLEFTSCKGLAKDSCKSRSVNMPPIR